MKKNEVDRFCPLQSRTEDERDESNRKPAEKPVAVVIGATSK